MERGALDQESVTRAARLLGVTPAVEPYAVRGAAVYRLTLWNKALSTELTIIIWPSLARVDVRIGDSAVVLKGIDEVVYYPGVEVMFRRSAPPASLFVSVGGRFGLTA